MFAFPISFSKSSATCCGRPFSRRKNWLFFPIALFILVVTGSGCAKIGAPTGGPKDITPPKYVGGEPENYSVNFKGNRIEFWFDEYIQFKNLNQDLLISPPLKQRPSILIKQKSVRIDLLRDTLAANTTYTINFGNAICDLNEGNILPDFQYVFSTGDHLDSLSVTGTALNAFDHKPMKDANIQILLYDKLNDSVPLREPPRYIGRANENGLFDIDNVHAGTYRILAVNDLNGNLKYDPASESVAFLDTFLVLDAETVKPVHFIRDTVKLQITNSKAKKKEKSQPVDTVKVKQGKNLNAVNVSLFYFITQSEKVYLTVKKRESPENLLFVFNRTPHDTVRIAPVNFRPPEDWYLRETSVNGDSITCWITDSLVSKMDTLMLGISYSTVDSAGRPLPKSDTVRLINVRLPEKGISGRRNRTVSIKPKEKKMAVTINNRNNKPQNLNSPVVLTADKPIAQIDADAMSLKQLKDSVWIPQTFTCTKDSISLRRFRLVTRWTESTPYILLLKPGAVRNIFGQTNDTLTYRFKTQAAEYYCRLIMTVRAKHFPLVIQLLDDNDMPIREKIVHDAGKFTLDFLPPGQYKLKAILDKNGNGRWDTGDYLKHLQPEPVYFDKLQAPLRSNWDYDIAWEIPD
jgi:uncharacterized protein (DUF2141 family)